MSGWKGKPPSRSRVRQTEHTVTFGGSIREITSPTNPTFKQCRDLLAGPGIRKHGEAILAGSRIRDEILRGSPSASWAG